MASNLRSKDARLRGTAVNVEGNRTRELATSAPTVSSGGKRTCKIARASCWRAAHKEWHKENDK